MANDKFQTGNTQRNSGFTIVELVVVMGIFLVIFSFAWINFSTLPSRTTSATSVQALVADLKSQQTQAMSGDSSGSGIGSDYGIYFGTNFYVLFKGSSYGPGSASNFRIDLEDANLNFSDNLPLAANHSIVFAKGSGEIENYVSGQDAVTIVNSLTNQNVVVRVNKYGATY